jgi:hypothetical protein
MKMEAVSCFEVPVNFYRTIGIMSQKIVVVFIVTVVSTSDPVEFCLLNLKHVKQENNVCHCGGCVMSFVILIVIENEQKYEAVCLLGQQTFQKNMSPPSAGLKISQARILYCTRILHK